jgi:hypothetical protein
MPPQSDRDVLRARFVGALLDAVRPLQDSPDRELALELLIEAAGVLQERLRGELTELRVEETD